jgi:hypothetical protein
MNRLYLIFSLLLGTMLCSCQNASFVEPVVPVPPGNNFWYTNASRDITGRIKLQDDQHGGYNPLPASKVVIAWEMPNDPSKSLYIYGSGTYSKVGKDDYYFTVHLPDSLPKFSLLGMDTTNVIAAGHIILISNTQVTDGDTLRHDLDWDNYQILGGMDNVGVIFVRGNPSLAGRKLTVANSFPGFNFMFAKKMDPSSQTVIDFEPAFPNDIEIEIDKDGHDCKRNTAFWLQ